MDKFSDDNLEDITKIAHTLYLLHKKKDGGLYDFIYDKTFKYWKKWDGSGSRFGYIKYMINLEIRNYYKTRGCRPILKKYYYEFDNSIEIFDSLSILSKNERTIIYQKFWNNYSLTELAKKYKVHINTIYKYYQSGLQKLRRVYVV